jgi:hypothetical protein
MMPWLNQTRQGALGLNQIRINRVFVGVALQKK